MRILIVNPFGIGDVLFSTPLVKAIRRAFPDCYLAYLCNARTQHILHGNPHLNELFVYEKDEIVRLWRTSKWQGMLHVISVLRGIRRARFDLMIDLSLGERYAFVLKLLAVRQRVGFDYRRRGRFLTYRLAIDGYHGQHVVEYYRNLLQHLGIWLLEDPLELRVSKEDEAWADRWLDAQGLGDGQLLVGIVPAGGVSWGVDAPFRRWSFEGFAAVGDSLAHRYGAKVILFGEASDRSVCRTVGWLMKERSIDLSGQTTLGQFVSLLGRLGLVICNDGGPLHLAVSRGVRTVSIFGPVDPEVYGPYPPLADGPHRTVCREELPCRPCYHQFRLPPCPYERACLTTIDPSQVLEACEDLLGQFAQPVAERSHAPHGAGLS